MLNIIDHVSSDFDTKLKSKNHAQIKALIEENSNYYYKIKSIQDAYHISKSFLTLLGGRELQYGQKEDNTAALYTIMFSIISMFFLFWIGSGSIFIALEALLLLLIGSAAAIVVVFTPVILILAIIGFVYHYITIKDIYGEYKAVLDFDLKPYESIENNRLEKVSKIMHPTLNNHCSIIDVTIEKAALDIKKLYDELYDELQLEMNGEEYSRMELEMNGEEYSRMQVEYSRMKFIIEIMKYNAQERASVYNQKNFTTTEKQSFEDTIFNRRMSIIFSKAYDVVLHDNPLVKLEMDAYVDSLSPAQKLTVIQEIDKYLPSQKDSTAIKLQELIRDEVSRSLGYANRINQSRNSSAVIQPYYLQ